MTEAAALPSLPFRLGVTTALQVEGVLKLRGLARVEGSDLLLEVQSDLVTLETTMDTHRIALADVSAVDLKSSWTGARLVLQPRRLQAFGAVPGLHDGRLVLKIKRGDRALASQWATTLGLALLDREP